MSDHISTAASLAKNFSQEQFESLVYETRAVAITIATSVEEPNSKITEIAKSVIGDYVDFTFLMESNGVPFKRRIDRALELTTEYYILMNDHSHPRVMEFGLLRGQDALFGASRVLHDHSTIEEEIGKINTIIQNRIKRYAERQKGIQPQKTQSNKPTRRRRSRKSSTRSER